MSTCANRQMSHEIHRDMLKRLGRVLYRLQETCGPLRGVFVSLTNRALFNKRFNTCRHATPIKTCRNNLQKLLKTQMTAQCTVVQITQNNMDTTTGSIR